MSINVAVLQGRLTADPELKTTPSGVSATSFSIAVERPYQKAGEERKADFINVVAWRYTAEFICKYFRKGSMIALQGAIQTRTYEDKNGVKRTVTEVVTDNVSFCDSKNNARPQQQAQAPSTPEPNIDVEPGDDLPF